MPLEGACASNSVKNLSGGKVESNAPLDVPIVMPEYKDGSSESKDTEDTDKVELDSCDGQCRNSWKPSGSVK